MEQLGRQLFLFLSLKVIWASSYLLKSWEGLEMVRRPEVKADEYREQKCIFAFLIKVN